MTKSSMKLRTRLGNFELMISMRICSFESSVQGEHSRKTKPNKSHCNSSHEFDDVLKILRISAFTVETTTATKINHAIVLPIRIIDVSIRRLNAKSPCIASPKALLPATFFRVWICNLAYLSCILIIFGNGSTNL